MDSVSLISSATNIITNAQTKAANAAQDIAQLSVNPNEVGSSETRSNSFFPPVLELKRAEIQAKAGAKVLKTQQEIIGSLFDDTA